MSNDAGLKDWNFQVLMLVQSMLGAITPNFRMVVLSRDDDAWVIMFYLQDDLEKDVEEVNDIICRYSAYQDSNLQLKWEIVFGCGELPVVPEADRVVYRRKEIFD
ncbi:hypothetical protein [Pseudomonas sp. SWRI99]|uniref:hypothetical protein n=1 Tax=Pseudomonas sp. SWRI99 TaxID=2745506 RepID=UPI001646D886|nr:hypothetical protein [Pseudomonas sp. SWRI99]MBC3776681.1 hypothetical protein [Pseudomonas sp. SWRI99]